MWALGGAALQRAGARAATGAGRTRPARQVGGIRRVIVPVELGYPNSDFKALGPAPSTFSGQRTLDFVLRNQGLIDRTLLFDIELVKVLS